MHSKWSTLSKNYHSLTVNDTPLKKLCSYMHPYMGVYILYTHRVLLCDIRVDVHTIQLSTHTYMIDSHTYV